MVKSLKQIPPIVRVPETLLKKRKRNQLAEQQRLEAVNKIKKVYIFFSHTSNTCIAKKTSKKRN